MAISRQIGPGAISEVIGNVGWLSITDQATTILFLSCLSSQTHPLALQFQTCNLKTLADLLILEQKHWFNFRLKIYQLFVARIRTFTTINTRSKSLY